MTELNRAAMGARGAGGTTLKALEPIPSLRLNQPSPPAPPHNAAVMHKAIP
jgi:hypothetical protein